MRIRLYEEIKSVFLVIFGSVNFSLIIFIGNYDFF